MLGTRPEAIEHGPLVLAARPALDLFTVTTIATGQHREKVNAVLATFGLLGNVDPDIGEASQRPADMLSPILLRLTPG